MIKVLVNNNEMLIDEEDLALFNDYNWTTYKARSGKPVASVMAKRKKLYFHRCVLGVICSSTQVDHINMNPLDNRKNNLRICEKGAQNAINRPPQKNNSSGYKGVFLRKDKNYSKPTYRAAIRVDQKLIHLGHFTDPKEAARVYNEAAVKYFGEFAWLNKIEE